MPEQKEEMFDEDELLHSGCGHVWSGAYGKTLCKRISRIRDLFAEHWSIAVTAEKMTL